MHPPKYDLPWGQCAVGGTEGLERPHLQSAPRGGWEILTVRG